MKNTHRYLAALTSLFLMVLWGCNKEENPITAVPPTIPLNLNTERIIFTTNRDGNDDLYIVDNDGSNLLKLTDNLGYDNIPVVAKPDSMIIFQSYRNNTHGIYTMNLDGSNQALVVETGVSLSIECWVPIVGTLLFTSGHSGVEKEIYTINLDGEDLTRLTSNNQIDGMPSSIGSEIVYYSTDIDHERQIFSMNFSGTQNTQLTYGSPAKHAPRLSLDGTKILYFQGGSNQRNFDLWIMNSDGTDKMKLATVRLIAHQTYYTAWAPSGNQIAFLSEVNDKEDLFIINTDGTGLLNLTNSNGDETSPTWSLDGDKIYFVSDMNGNSGIYQIDTDGSNLKKIIDNTVDNVNLMCVVD